MTLYKQWHDFVLYRAPYRVKTEAERLDVSKAVRFSTRSPLEYLKTDDKQIAENGVVFQEFEVVSPGDEFEAMEIRSLGQITIWTKKRVYGIIIDGGIEKLRFFVRNPPAD